MKKTIHVKQYYRKKHGRADHGGAVSAHNKSGRALTPFRRKEATAKILRGSGTYHNMMEDEALHSIHGKVRVVYKTEDKQGVHDHERWFPTYNSAFAWASKATQKGYKDVYID